MSPVFADMYTDKLTVQIPMKPLMMKLAFITGVHSEEGMSVIQDQKYVCDKHKPPVSASVSLLHSVCLLYHHQKWL